MTFDEGMCFFKKGEYHDAAKEFTIITKSDEKNHKAWNALGICLSKDGNFDQAAICFENALTLVPENEIYIKNIKKNAVNAKKKINQTSIDSGAGKQQSKSNSIKNTSFIDQFSNLKCDSISCNIDQYLGEYYNILDTFEKAPRSKNCLSCGTKKNFFNFGKLCKQCSEKLKLIKELLIEAILKSDRKITNVSSNHVKFIKSLNTSQKYDILLNICKHNNFKINQEFIQFFAAIFPQIDIFSPNDDFLKNFYSQYIRDYYNSYYTLPNWIGSNPPGIRIPLANNENIYFITKSRMEEPVSRRNYSGVSHGMSFRVAKGVSYRVGTYGGQSRSVYSFEEVSSGYLFVTNKRLQLVPISGNKQANIPLNKISSFVQYKGKTIEISKTGREKPFRFIFPNETTSDIANLCISACIYNK